MKDIFFKELKELIKNKNRSRERLCSLIEFFFDTIENKKLYIYMLCNQMYRNKVIDAKLGILSSEYIEQCSIDTIKGIFCEFVMNLDKFTLELFVRDFYDVYKYDFDRY